jgi:uncharacterized protein YjiS (DUF1127 family)
MISNASASTCGSSACHGDTARRPSGFARIQDLLIRAFDALSAWQERARDRRQLAALDDRMLHDIGVDPASAAEEVFKPFWRR